MQPYSSSAAGTLTVSSVRSHGGSYSLATNVTVSYSQQKFIVSFTTTNCANGGLNLVGKTIRAWIYFDGPAINSSSSFVYVYGTQGTSYTPGGTVATTVNGQWFQVTGIISTTATDGVIRTFNIETNLNVDGWTGTVYLDDVIIQ